MQEIEPSSWHRSLSNSLTQKGRYMQPSSRGSVPQDIVSMEEFCCLLTFRCRIKSRLPFAGIIRSSPYSADFQDKG